jgi:hypothetical protein
MTNQPTHPRRLASELEHYDRELAALEEDVRLEDYVRIQCVGLLDRDVIELQEHDRACRRARVPCMVDDRRSPQ